MASSPLTWLALLLHSSVDAVCYLPPDICHHLPAMPACNGLYLSMLSNAQFIILCRWTSPSLRHPYHDLYCIISLGNKPFTHWDCVQGLLQAGPAGPACSASFSTTRPRSYERDPCSLGVSHVLHALLFLCLFPAGFISFPQVCCAKMSAMPSKHSLMWFYLSNKIKNIKMLMFK